MTLTATLASGQNITGTGNLLVTSLSTAVYDGSNINISGTYKIELFGIIDSNTNFTPAGGTPPNLVPTAIMTVKGSIISGLTINNGSGGVNTFDVIVNRFAATDTGNYRNIKVNKCTYTVDNTESGPSEVTFEGQYKNLSTTIFFNIVTGYTAIFSETGGYVAEILQFISSSGTLSAQSSKIVTFQGLGTLKLELTNYTEDPTSNATLLKFTDTALGPILFTNGTYTDLTGTTVYSITKIGASNPVVNPEVTPP